MTTTTIRHVLSYVVPRNGRGSLAVYSDIRNTRYLVEIRNVQGSVQSLVRDLHQSFSSLSVRVKHQRHIILSGDCRKRDVLAWLTAKGF